MPTAAAYDAVSDESRPASRARASGGSTVTRTAVAASARTMNTPYAAKKPSVSAVRAELARDDHADDRREARLHRDPERRDGARRQ